MQQRYLHEAYTPLMAEADTVEQVDAGGVTYKSPARTVRATFSADNYRLNA